MGAGSRGRDGRRAGRPRGWALAAVVAGLVVAGLARGRAGAQPADAPGLARWWREVVQAVEVAVGERSRRPPVPVAVTWRERRIASIDLGAPLLALTAVDMERDGRAELAALTTDAVVLLAPAGTAMREIARLALPGDPAAIRPRDPVGALAVDGRQPRVELLARSSELADGVALTWRDGALREERRVAGFPLCAGMQAELVPGRNYFDGSKVRWEEHAPARFEPPAAFFAAACRTDLADPGGHLLSVTAAIDTERVAHVACRAEQGECPEGPAQGDYAGVGVALEIADIDNDGVPELLTTRGGAPGDRDRISVYARQAGRILRVFSKEFHAGVVGLAAGDLDGDGDRDVVVAVRFVGSRHVSFWTLN
jgi:hypothetical protein